MLDKVSPSADCKYTGVSPPDSHCHEDHCQQKHIEYARRERCSGEFLGEFLGELGELLSQDSCGHALHSTQHDRSEVSRRTGEALTRLREAPCDFQRARGQPRARLGQGDHVCVRRSALYISNVSTILSSLLYIVGRPTD